MGESLIRKQFRLEEMTWERAVSESNKNHAGQKKNKMPGAEALHWKVGRREGESMREREKERERSRDG